MKLNKLHVLLGSVLSCVLLYSCEKSHDYYVAQEESIYKNLVGYDFNSVESYKIQKFDDGTFLMYGLKQEYICFLYFDENGKWDEVLINRLITVDKGYGETETDNIEYINLTLDSNLEYYMSTPTSNGYIVVPEYSFAGDNISQAIDGDILILNNSLMQVSSIDNTAYNYSLTRTFVIPWYEDSFVVLHSGSYTYSSYSQCKLYFMDGTFISDFTPVDYSKDYCSSYTLNGVPTKLEVISYSNVLIRRSYSSNIIYSCVDYTTDASVWSRSIPISDYVNCTSPNINIETTSTGNDIKEFRMTIVNIDGSSSILEYSINLSTGDLLFL